jgi:hypothetical protein
MPEEDVAAALRQVPGVKARVPRHDGSAVALRGSA